MELIIRVLEMSLAINYNPNCRRKNIFLFQNLCNQSVKLKKIFEINLSICFRCVNVKQEAVTTIEEKKCKAPRFVNRRTNNQSPNSKESVVEVDISIVAG